MHTLRSFGLSVFFASAAAAAVTLVVSEQRGSRALPGFASPPARSAQTGAGIAAARVDITNGHQAAFEAAYAMAYARYPAIPRGTLEAIAYARSRGRHLRPDAHDRQHGPPAYGVMGLYAGEGGFDDQVALAATALGVPPSRVVRDPATNILAAAALLDRELRIGAMRDAKAAQGDGIETIAPALMRFAGFADPDASQRSEIRDYARASFAFEVLRALDTGRIARAGSAPIRTAPIRWERAFDTATLARLNAPFIRLDLRRDTIETADFVLDPIDETLKPRPAAAAAKTTTDVGILSADYPPAQWIASPYHGARSAAVSAVTLHTMQGSYAGTISWFQNNPYEVSAHYLVRSSDGQVTQMVSDARAAHHVGSHNSYTIGIEHEGYVDNASWYTAAMYSASANLTKHVCARYGIDCKTAYNGVSHSGLVLLPTSTKIKGHQHFSNQTHTDPGINWDWRRYYSLLNPANALSLDNFEAGVGRFDTAPTYSGSTVGVSTASSSARVCDSGSKQGSCRLRLSLQDNTASASAWQVRLLSASGQPTANAKLTKAGGHLGFWVYPAASGVSVAMSVDDSDGTERSVAKSLPANTWTYVEWRLDDGAQWDAWAGGDGIITSTTAATLDAIWFYRADSNGATVTVAIDDVRLELK
jgi:N-acetyl-anhydromuramyl-L-alanine amidase AmpD